jgi:outer membrane lipopolysaccharide assembly protein LptE/RlpB
MVIVERVFLLLIILSLNSCGYTLAGGGSVLPPDVQRVYVPMAENNTPESGLSLTITEALRDRFERFGVLFVVENRSDADAVLRTKILSVKRNTRTVTSGTDTALQLDSILTLACELRRVTGPLLWRNDKIMVSKSFGTSSDVVVTSSADFTAGSLNASDLGELDTRELSRGQEREVLEQLAEEAAKQVYTEAVLPDF